MSITIGVDGWGGTECPPGRRSLGIHWTVSEWRRPRTRRRIHCVCVPNVGPFVLMLIRLSLCFRSLCRQNSTSLCVLPLLHSFHWLPPLLCDIFIHYICRLIIEKRIIVRKMGARQSIGRLAAKNGTRLMLLLSSDGHIFVFPFSSLCSSATRCQSIGYCCLGLCTLIHSLSAWHLL